MQELHAGHHTVFVFFEWQHTHTYFLGGKGHFCWWGWPVVGLFYSHFYDHYTSQLTGCSIPVTDQVTMAGLFAYLFTGDDHRGSWGQIILHQVHHR